MKFILTFGEIVELLDEKAENKQQAKKILEDYGFDVSIGEEGYKYPTIIISRGEGKRGQAFYKVRGKQKWMIHSIYKQEHMAHYDLLALELRDLRYDRKDFEDKHFTKNVIEIEEKKTKKASTYSVLNYYKKRSRELQEMKRKLDRELENARYKELLFNERGF